MNYISIDSNDWFDAGVIYKVISYKENLSSSAVNLILERNGEVLHRTVASQSIKWEK